MLWEINMGLIPTITLSPSIAKDKFFSILVVKWWIV